MRVILLTYLLYFIPIRLNLLLQIICGSAQRCLYFDRMPDQEHQLAAVEDLVLSLATLPFIGCFGFGFLYDRKYTRAWQVYAWTARLPLIRRRWPIFRDIAALSATALVAFALEDGTNGLTIRGVFLWAVVACLACFHSVLFEYMAEKIFMGVIGTAWQYESKPRAQRPVIFGLRYGLAAYACNFQMSFVDAVIVLRLAKSLLIRKMPTALTVETSECIFCEFTGKWRLWTAIAAARLSMIAAAGMDDLCVDTIPLRELDVRNLLKLFATTTFGDVDGNLCYAGAPKHFVNMGLDLITLISVNVSIYSMMKAAEYLGRYLLKNRPGTNAIPGVTGPRVADFGPGALALIGWVLSFGVLLTA